MTQATPPADLTHTVRSVVAEALARDVSEVLPHANLMEDLGAESLDFLDIGARRPRRHVG
jgi:acyl carrier protein